MCSILGIFEITQDLGQLRRLALKLSKRQRHRGPDWSGVHTCPSAILAHERLAIVDIEHGAQPLFNSSRDISLAVNGEIYNHKALEAGLAQPWSPSTGSDCEVILALYEQRGYRLSQRSQRHLRVCAVRRDTRPILHRPRSDRRDASLYRS